jgi:5-methylcytosine-specific restriction endonuclease McrA
MWEDCGWCCEWCGKAIALGGKTRRNGMTLATLDHIIPVSRGGLNVTENLKWACVDCNSRRGDRMPMMWVEVEAA